MLNNNSDNFERGKLDTFSLEMPLIGVLSKARVEIDNSGLFPGFFFEKKKERKKGRKKEENTNQSIVK